MNVTYYEEILVPGNYLGVIKLQKRGVGVIADTNNQASSVTLFNGALSLSQEIIFDKKVIMRFVC